MALGAMIVPENTFSVSFNASTYRGEQGFTGSVTVRLGEKVYVNGGVTGSTARNSTSGRGARAARFAPLTLARIAQGNADTKAQLICARNRIVQLGGAEPLLIVPFGLTQMKRTSGS